MDRRLYNLPVPEDAQIDTGTTLSRQLSAQGSVGDGGEGAVESISLDPGQQLVQGSYRDPTFGGMMARSLEELFQAGGIEYVPYYGVDGHDTIDGYYALDNVDVGPADASTDAIQTYDGQVTKVGTKQSHVRAVRTAPQPVDTVGASNYANDDPPPNPEQVCLPVDAQRPRWFDPLSGTIERADPLNKWQYPEREGELSNYRVYALSQASFYDPTESAPTPPVLVYSLPYGREYQSDVRAWDTTPNEYTSEKVIAGDLGAGTQVGGPGASVGEAIVGGSPTESNVAVASAWQNVFRASHEFRGECVLDNGVLRLRLDADRGAITAQTSRGHFDAWADQPLRPSAWALREFDVTHIGLARVDAQVEWEHGNTGAQYVTDVALPRGYDRAIWTVAQNQSGAAPYGLAQKLAPVAQFGGVTVRVPNQRAGLVAREELRR